MSEVGHSRPAYLGVACPLPPGADMVREAVRRSSCAILLGQNRLVESTSKVLAMVSTDLS
jgi:hypothetical protein